MGAEYLFYMKFIETHARAFLPLNKSAIGSVMNFTYARAVERTENPGGLGQK